MNYYLGLDIGGTTIKAVLMRDFNDKEPQCFGIDTPKSKKEFLRILQEFTKKILFEQSREDTIKGGSQPRSNNIIKGIGAGLPGILDPKREVLLKAPHLPFLNGWRPKEFFKKFGAAVQIENDANCFVLAEHKRGAAKGYKNVVGLAVGTGIGGGIIMNGKLYRGSHGSAGEFGHTILRIKNPELRIMNTEKLEELAAKKAFEKYGDRSKIIGTGVANLINSLDPDIVVLGGGGVASGEIKMNTVRQVAKQNILSPLVKKTPIVRGKLGEYTQAMGAVLLLKNSS